MQKTTMAKSPTEPRVTVDLPVRIWGLTAEGKAFSQRARAQNISSEGALLNGVESELKVGDVIGVECDDQKARCTVIWVVNAGAMKKNQIGVRLLTSQKCPWTSYLSKDATNPSFSDLNRRRFYRHKIGFPLELRDERLKTPVRINTTDVSGNGCYVESMMPMPAGTPLRIDFWLDSEHVNIAAVVRTCDPGVGNGIEFTGLSPEGKAHVQAYLDAIDPQMGIAEPGPE